MQSSPSSLISVHFLLPQALRRVSTYRLQSSFGEEPLPIILDWENLALALLLPNPTPLLFFLPHF